MRQIKCRCPIWVHGKVRGERIRKSLETLNWEAAVRISRQWEEEGTREGSMSVEAACERFTAYAEANHLKSATLGKYKLLFDEMKDVFDRRPVSSVTVDELCEYREGWKVGAVTARGKIGRLRAFFNFCVDSGWCKANPAAMMKLPKEKFNPKIPFSAQELEKVM